MDKLYASLSSFVQNSPVDVKTAGQSLWMIIALPLLGALICGVFGKVIGRSNTHLVAVSAVAGSFILSVLSFWATVNGYATDGTWAIGADFGTWFSAGSFKVNFGLFADHLNASMLLVITGVGLLIHIYSTSYMSHDAGYWRFFAYLNLFVAAMLTLVLADSLPLLFVGWEGVGLCSYLLIGFWYDDPAKAFAGRKAFITNRIGDFGFLVASFLLVLVIDAMQTQVQASKFQPGRGEDSTVSAKRFGATVQQKGPLAFAVLEEAAKTLPNVQQDVIASGPLAGRTFGSMLTVIMLLFLLGAAGKSAQIPLYVWLPDAMAGPTPVSALIHAATMVTSGLYLFCRISYLLVLSPTAMAAVALIGATTALIAALIAFSQKGLKKVLAYSTVSQLGLMFLGIGAGAFWAAFLHVVTHAFFKACLFLGAGSVMHGNGDEEDITKLGGLRKQMPTTWFTFLIATFAITGIVPLSGFFSKDAILHAAHTNTIVGYHWALHLAGILGTLTAACTAFYMMRMYFVAFEGERSKDARVPQAHESSAAMTAPLAVLAAGSVALLFWGIPVMANGETLMENYLTPVFRTTMVNLHHSIERPAEHESMWGPWGQAWLIALVSGAVAFYLYRIFLPSRKGQPLPVPLEALRSFSFNKFYVDELYNYLLIRPLVWVAKTAWFVIDSILIDTVVVRGSGWVTRQTAAMVRLSQSGDAQSYAAVMVLALASALIWALMKVVS